MKIRESVKHWFQWNLLFRFRVFVSYIAGFFPKAKKKRQAFETAQKLRLDQEDYHEEVVGTVRAYTSKVEAMFMKEDAAARARLKAAKIDVVILHAQNETYRTNEAKAIVSEAEAPFKEIWDRALSSSGMRTREEYHKNGQHGNDRPILTDDEILSLTMFSVDQPRAEVV